VINPINPARIALKNPTLFAAKMAGVLMKKPRYPRVASQAIDAIKLIDAKDFPHNRQT